ncbi:MAG: HAD family hydrolase [Mariprofundaceae bacterium]|nr:HAD family hydrolase [Mariprofundaceae bacterium]
MNSTPKGIFIDFDGTLINAFEAIILAWQETLSFFGHELYSGEKIRRMTGKNDTSFAGIFGQENEKKARQIFYDTHDKVHLKHLQILEGAEELLLGFKQKNIPVVLLTNKVESCAVQQVSHLGWQHYFDHIIGAVPHRPSKPDPTGLLLGCQHIQQQAQNCLMIGDGLNDMQVAKHTGCTAIGICADFNAQELKEAGATHCFNNLNEVHTWLNPIN